MFIRSAKKLKIRIVLLGLVIWCLNIGDVYAANYPSAVLRSGIWQQLNIPVCWENPEANNVQERQWVRDAVERTWQEASRIRFSGWDACPVTAAIGDGIRILIANEHPHVKRLGRALDGLRNGMVLAFEFDIEGFRDCIAQTEFCVRAIAVHEFGHALGLAHEHNRNDATRCMEEPQGTNGDWYLTEYDPDSVMNYCNPDWNGNGLLSAADRIGVQFLYGVPCGPWSSGDQHTLRLYAGQNVLAMVPYEDGLITAFDQGGIYYSPSGTNPGGGCETSRLYLGQKVLAMIGYDGGLITAFEGGGIYHSPDGQNPGGGGNTKRLYQGQKVQAMIPFRDGVVTAFEGGGIYYSPDGQNPGGGGSTVHLYQGQKVLAMTPFKKGFATAFEGGGVYYSPDGQSPGGGGNTERLYRGQQVIAMTSFRDGLVVAFSGRGLYLSPDGSRPGGGGSTARIYAGQGVIELAPFRTGFVASFTGGGIYYSPRAQFLGQVR